MSVFNFVLQMNFRFGVHCHPHPRTSQSRVNKAEDIDGTKLRGSVPHATKWDTRVNVDSVRGLQENVGGLEVKRV